MSGVPYDSNQELPLCTRRLRFIGYTTTPRKTNPSHIRPLPWAHGQLRCSLSRDSGASQTKLGRSERQYFQRVQRRQAMLAACSGAFQKHELLLTSTYNRSQIIGSMIHVRCSRYLVTHEGSFEYQFHKDGRNMLFSPFSLNGHSPEAWFDSPKRKAKGQGLRPVSIIGKGKV